MEDEENIKHAYITHEDLKNLNSVALDGPFFIIEAPKDTDTNSSNCLLNAFANHCHLERYHFHPYVWEIANMVRQGVMERGEGIEKIYADQKQEMVEYARERLNA